MIIDEAILQNAIDAWGIDAQCEMIEEECMELALALQKFKRVRGSKQDKYENIIDEIADVTIMITQAHKIFDADLIQSRIDFKMNRLKDRLVEQIA
jgi:NTP pyrophosphatase (non-canonical NTP hydrolase)